MASPVPIPNEIKKLRGNPGQRRIRPEPKFRKDGSIPAAPRWLTDLAKQEWERVAPEVYRLGLLTKADLGPFMAYCQAFGRWMQAEMALAEAGGELVQITEKGIAMHSPLVTVASKACHEMVKYAAEFGLTPASRSRIAVAEEKTNDEFDDLLAN